MTSRAMSDFARLTRFVRLDGYLETRSALRVSAGRALDAGSASDLPVMKDIMGRPFIPGSSLKGVLRSYVESLARSSGGLLSACDPVAPDYSDGSGRDICVSPKQYAEEEKQKRTHDREVPGGLCDVCNTFGHPLFAARLRFQDLSVDKDTWHEFLLQVRDGVAIDRETGTAADKRKYDFEVVPPEVRFNLRIIGENIEDWQLGLLFLAIDHFNAGLGRLGGGTSRGMGEVSITFDKYIAATPADLLTGDARTLEKTDCDSFHDTCMAALKAKLAERTPAPAAEPEPAGAEADLPTGVETEGG